MHDLAISQHIAEHIKEYAKKHGLKRITKVVIDIGKDDCLTRENLEFNLRLCLNETAAKDAEIEIIKTSGKNFVLREIEGG